MDPIYIVYQTLVIAHLRLRPDSYLCIPFATSARPTFGLLAMNRIVVNLDINNLSVDLDILLRLLGHLDFSALRYTAHTEVDSP